MRRKDREKDEAFALQMVDKCKFATVAMVTPEGKPYCVPLSIVRVGNLIYFHSAMKGEKIDNLKANPQICMACVGDVEPLKDKFTTAFESAVVKGKAEQVTDSQEKIEALRAICLRYTPENMAQFDQAIAHSLNVTDVWRISMDEVTGKAKVVHKEDK